MTTRDDSFESRRARDLENAVRDAAPDAFAPGFGGRVVARLRAEAVRDRASFDDVLQRQFVRMVPIVAAASLMLGAYNWWGARASATSVIDAVLRLPQVTIASAYSSDALFDGTGQPMEQP